MKQKIKEIFEQHNICIDKNNYYMTLSVCRLGS